METKTAFDRIDSILAVPELASVGSIVIERVDLCYSLRLGADDINKSEVNERVELILKKIKQHNVKTTIGGGV